MKPLKQQLKTLLGVERIQPTPEPPTPAIEHFRDYAPGEHLQKVAAGIRGDYPPAVLIHGIQQRSGTVFLGELLRLHPALHAFPNDIWEIPLLQNIDHAFELQHSFNEDYRHNKGKTDDGLFVPLIGAAFINYLYSHTDGTKPILMKQPSVAQLDQFPLLFPKERLVIIIRDGRDVVSSMIKTWPHIQFADACANWDTAAREIINYQQKFPAPDSHTLVKYETCVSDPRTVIEQIFTYLNIDPTAFPYDKLDDVKVIGSSKLHKPGEVEWNHAEKPKEFKTSGSWEAWNEDQKRVFQKQCSESMQALGYS